MSVFFFIDLRFFCNHFEHFITFVPQVSWDALIHLAPNTHVGPGRGIQRGTQVVTLLISEKIFLQKVDKISNGTPPKPRMNPSYHEAADSNQGESNKETKQASVALRAPWLAYLTSFQGGFSFSLDADRGENKSSLDVCEMSNEISNHHNRLCKVSSFSRRPTVANIGTDTYWFTHNKAAHYSIFRFCFKSFQ